MRPPKHTVRQPAVDQERTDINSCSEPHSQERHDRYGPLLSALFEGSPTGFVTSTPKQTRTAPGTSSSPRTINDSGDTASPCAKEDSRYGKEWPLAAPRNRRNMSLGGGSLKAPSSSTHSMYINSGQALGQCFSKDPPSQSSSLDSLASFYSGAATPEKRYTVKNAKLLKTTKSDMHFSKPDSDDLDVPLPGSISITTSNPDLCAYNDNMHTTPLTLVWERPEKRRGGPSGHNRSHSLASSPSGALGRRETSRRHAIYCGPGVSDISIPYDDPEETRVNPSRSTIASFDSNKAVFEDSFSDSPKKRKDSLLAGFAPASPVKRLSNTPEHVLRFFNITTGVSDTRYYDTSITAVTSSSSDEEMSLHLGPSKENVSIVLPLKIQSATKRNSVGGVKRVTNPEDISTTIDSDALEHLPLMHELLDLVEEATKSWQLLWL